MVSPIGALILSYVHLLCNTMNFKESLAGRRETLSVRVRFLDYNHGKISQDSGVAFSGPGPWRYSFTGITD